MNTVKQLLYSATATLVLFACGNKQEPKEPESDLIEITSKQFATNAMQLGEIETKTFESIVKCNGTIVPFPNGMAKVNAPVNGIIKSINCHNGQWVEKDQLLIEIAGNEIIDLQKEFAEASANYSRLQNEYKRIKSLYTEKVISEKEFIVAESEYKTAMARYNGLRMKTEAIGFAGSKIENGAFYSSYSIKSPINGYISDLKANLGTYTDTQSGLLEIINPDLFQIKLSVFATDIANLKKGQTVRFKSSNTNSINTATLSSIGISIDNDTRSIKCFASVNDNKLMNPIANEFVESEIIIDSDTVPALPSDAIIKNETGTFILVLVRQEKGKYFFRKAEVKTGRQYKGFTEIPETKADGPIITNGVYNISR